MTDTSRELKRQISDTADAVGKPKATIGVPIAEGPPPIVAMAASLAPVAQKGKRGDNIQVSAPADTVKGAVGADDVFMVGAQCKPHNKFLILTVPPSEKLKTGALHIVVGSLRDYTIAECLVDVGVLNLFSQGLFNNMMLLPELISKKYIMVEIRTDSQAEGGRPSVFATFTFALLGRKFELPLQLRETDPVVRLRDVLSDFAKYREVTSQSIKMLQDQNAAYKMQLDDYIRREKEKTSSCTRTEPQRVTVVDDIWDEEFNTGTRDLR